MIKVNYFMLCFLDKKITIKSAKGYGGIGNLLKISGAFY